MTKTTEISPHDVAIDLASKYQSRDLNEADTRHQLIDIIIHDVLSWPRSLTDCESYISPGYSDYRLKDRNNRLLLFIEAKKEGVYFNTPINFDNKILSKYVAIKTLLTDKNIKSAIKQVRDYCIIEGCEFASITNGHEWIFFKTFEKQKKWEELKAFVIKDITYFSDNYTEAVNTFSFSALSEKASLVTLLSSSSPLNRDTFYSRDKITSFNHAVSSNRFATNLRPLADRYLGVMDPDDAEFMDSCYVNQRDFTNNYNGVQNLIYDCLTPYFKGFDVKDFFDDKKGGALGRQISDNLKYQRTREVIILCGGKGSGKTTFIRKLLFHKPPEYINRFSIVSVIDLLDTPENQEIINTEIWNQLLQSLDANKLLEQSRGVLVDLFSDKFDIAQKQDLYGLDSESTAYNIELNKLIQTWKADKIYCAQRLTDYWKRKNKGVIIVVDNTDQYGPVLQDYCFSVAQQISSILNCLVVVSMREERFYESKAHGTLDAFKNTAFHLSSPSPHLVFSRRVSYIKNIFKDLQKIKKEGVEIDTKSMRDLEKLFDIFLKEFTNTRSPLNKFITACTHGDIRQALDFFKEYLLSGYLNIDEMISKRQWTIQIHQVLKPMMIPFRFFYLESESSVPNVFQLRSKINNSHFTLLRLLEYLSNKQDKVEYKFIPVAELRNYFADLFNMVDDCEKNIDTALKRGLIESSNRLDEFSDNVDSLRITTYGVFMLKELSSKFTYIDLVCTDCGTSLESVANTLAEFANTELKMFFNREKFNRVLKRIAKAETFIDYLIDEELKEVAYYKLGPEIPLFASKIRNKFMEEKTTVLNSAKRYK